VGAGPIQRSLAYCRAYNRWIADFCRESAGRLVPIAHLTLLDPEGSAAELKRAVADGCKGGWVAPFTHTRKGHGHPDHDPLWRAAVELDVPIAIHPTYEPLWSTPVRFDRLGRSGEFHYNVTLRQGVQQAFLTFLDYGTLERFPSLRLGILESGMGWLGPFLDRCDAVFETVTGRGVPIRSKPSEIFARQCFISEIRTRPPPRCSSSTSARTSSCGRPTTRTRIIPRRGSTPSLARSRRHRERLAPPISAATFAESTASEPTLSTTSSAARAELSLLDDATKFVYNLPGKRGFGGRIRAAGAASLWPALGGWVAAAGPSGPAEMLRRNGSLQSCGGAGGSSIACRLAYGASGTVVDARSGEPIGGAVVTVLDVTTTSNPDGTYGAFGNHPETCHLDYYVPITAHADGYAPYFDALYTSVPIRYADIRLEPLDSGTGNAITGVVAESPHCEGGMNGVTVVLEPLGLQTESGTADHGTPAGYFEFNNLPPGEYTLRTEPPCNLHGCWDPVTVSVSTSDVDASLCLLPRRNAVQVSVGRAVGAPGGNTTVDVTIADANSAGGDPARVSATIGFEPDARIMVEGDNSPACDAVADVEAAAFTWLPAGCTPGIACTAVHTELQIGALALNNGTVLFRCGVATPSVSPTPATIRCAVSIWSSAATPERRLRRSASTARWSRDFRCRRSRTPSRSSRPHR
jgi:hypothetical protein